MKKTWIYKRKGIKGWWVGWYESGKRKAKALPSKELADHFCHIKYTQLNSEVFTGTVSLEWTQLKEEYNHSKKVEGVTESTLYEISLTLRHFENLTIINNSKQLSQNLIDKYITQRSREVQRATMNKDLRNLKAFVNWCKSKRYINDDIKIKLLKEAERPVKSLNENEIKKLLLTCQPYPSMKMRVLLALGTGLRRGDIDSLKISDIDYENNSINTTSRKTRKSMPSRPVPEPVMTELKIYLSEQVNDGKIFDDKFNYKRWRKICKKAGLSGLKFHGLRKTFASLLAQNGVSTAVTQRLLEHSSPALTSKVYINVDPVLRQAVDRLPIREWV